MRINIESFILRHWLTGLWNLASPECRVNQQAEEQGDRRCFGFSPKTICWQNPPMIRLDLQLSSEEPGSNVRYFPQGRLIKMWICLKQTYSQKYPGWTPTTYPSIVAQKIPCVKLDLCKNLSHLSGTNDLWTKPELSSPPCILSGTTLSENNVRWKEAAYDTTADNSKLNKTKQHISYCYMCI